MWRHYPEFKEAQRRIKEGVSGTSTRTDLNEGMVQQLVMSLQTKVVDDDPEMALLESIADHAARRPALPLMDTKIIDAAIVTWGPEKQCTQLVEECGEYVTEAMHLLFRPDRPDDLPHFLEEVVGVRIAVDHVIRLYQEECERIYHDQIGKEIAAMKKSCGEQGIPYDLD